MREIRFRGKNTSFPGKGWAEGSLLYGPDFCFILEDEDAVHPANYPCIIPDLGVVDGHLTTVDPETLGQYTGKDDKNGTKIFEGDLVQAVLPSTKAMGGFEWPLMPVVFRGGIFGLLTDRDEIVPFANYAPAVTLEVKGNIHDHPEMLKGANANEG